MKELSIANFKYGLDSRREALTSLLGTLVTCENAHINSGGEVEKRKAFVIVNGFNILDSNDDQGIYWAEVSDEGFTLIGSALEFGSAVTLNQPVLASAVPAGYVYQQLKHPSVIEGENYDRLVHKILSVKFSKVFDGKVFIAATFVDGNTFLYYDGELIKQSRNGRVLAGQTTLAELSTTLAEQIEALTDWNAIANTDQAGNAQNGTTIVKSPYNVYFTPVIETESDAGQLGASFVDKDQPEVSETKASASFQVTSFVGTYELTAPANSDGTGVAALTGGPVTAITSTTVTAGLIVQAINDLTYVHGYTAIKNATDSVFVYAPAGWGASINGFDLTVTVAGGGGTGGGGGVPVDMNGSVTPSPLAVSRVLNTPAQNRLVSGQVTASVSGGTAPYTFLWEELSAGSGNGIAITNNNSPTASFSVTTPGVNTCVQGAFKCTISDSAIGPQSIVVPLTVQLCTEYNSGN